ncbi:MAG: LysR family transcriptional regulator [Thermotogales bacterium]|nr:LysR family transcriptional regulator [Thermotogales bacterium]
MARLEDMETFARVVEAGSISGAAERLGVAKSVVSRRIANLEERLGAQLFRRTTRRLNLTDTANSFYDRCMRILADVQEAEDAVSDEHATLHGRLRVAVPLSFGLMHLGPAIDDFMKAHPDVEFDLDFNDRQVDLLTEGFDVAVRIAHLADSSFIARRLATIKVAMCASPDYLERSGTPRAPAELRDHACLTYSNLPDPSLWIYDGPDGKRVSVRVKSRLQANNGDFMREAVIAGQGIASLPTFLVYKAIEQGQLIRILPDYASPGIDAYAVYPQTRHLSHRVRAFVDFLAERFAGVPYWDAHLPI